MADCSLSECRIYEYCLWDCGKVSVKTESKSMLTEEDIKALDEFRFAMLECAELEATKLVAALKMTYPELDIQEFLNIMDTAIDDFTYESMVEEDEEVGDDE